jgi:hypothetical protein
MVQLPGGWQVPRRFTRRLLGRARRTPVECEIAVEVIDGTPHLRAVALAARDPQVPLSAADLAGLSLTGILDEAMRQAQLEHTTREWVLDDNQTAFTWPAFKDWVLEQTEADQAAALAAARTARSRRRITHADLRRVRDIHAAKGIPGVMVELGYSERNARRLWARAKKELP